MSKSKGNVIDPMVLTEKYGTDAFRIGLAVGNTPGTSLALAEERIRGYKNFGNKIWNMSRFVLLRENKGEIINELKDEFDKLARDMTLDMENYRFYMASEKIYHYLWHRFADEIIEESKPARPHENSGAGGGKPEYGATLYYILENSLKLLHPFMPFITEEIWQELQAKSNQQEAKSLLMIEPWPVQ